MTTEAKSTPEHDQLSRFVGRWNTEGKIRATPASPEVKITGTDTYEWLPGEYFLLHKVDVWVGDDKNETLEVIGYDQRTGKYTMQHFDNKGNAGTMTASYEKGVWTFQGETLRFTGGFKNEDNEFSGIWEQLTNDHNWTHWMDIQLMKE